MMEQPPAASASDTPIPATGRPHVVIPAHNRRETTLACLDALCQQEVFNWAHVVVIDDGSTDGTAEAIRQRHPQVRVLSGDGNLWWGGCIQKGVDYALEQGCSQVIWLNDDSIPEPGTMRRLSQYCQDHPDTIASAYTLNVGGGVYRGFRDGWADLSRPPRNLETDVYCDASNGNCVCFDRSIVEAVGPLPYRHLPQNYGDTYYTLRATRQGYRLVLLHDAICQCNDKMTMDRRSWLYSEAPLRSIWALLLSPRSTLYPPARFYYYWQLWGFPGLIKAGLPYLKLSLASILRLLVPRRLLLRLPGSRSQAWINEQHRNAPGNSASH